MMDRLDLSRKFLLFAVGEGRKTGKADDLGRNRRGLGVSTIRMSADAIRL